MLKSSTNTHLVRSAVDELKLKKKQQQKSLINKTNNTENKKPTVEPTCSSSLKNRDFKSHHFYLDNIDNQHKNRLERRLTILGATIEAFFSKKCTHVITSKAETTSHKATQQENIPPSISNKQKSQQDIVDKAKNLGIQVWRLDEAIQILSARFNASQNKRKQPHNKKALGDIYRNEKVFGPSTNTKDHTRRPQFAEFTGHYLTVEDVTKVHRPPVIRQYTRDIVDKDDQDVPWPCLNLDISNHNSPFHKEPKDDLQTPTVVNDEKKMQYNATQAVTPLAIHHNDASPAPSTVSKAPLLTPVGGMDSQLRASGYQPSIPNTQSTLRCCVSGQLDSQSKADSNSRHVIEKQCKKEIQLSQRQEKDKKKQNDIDLRRKQQQQQQQQLKEKDQIQNQLYCENCNERFTHFREHFKSETHQAFIKDQNNYKELDAILKNTTRPLKSSSTQNSDMNKRNYSEFALDMTDIQAPCNKMLKYTSETDLPHPIRIQDGGKYCDVFLP
ncbi:hypothetical protein K501DRAFT_335234 [Backusella circina FSU 941]|nr:hypothetical protein K501DRAFT_335234 [Backusella circina FSU 941]